MTSVTDTGSVKSRTALINTLRTALVSAPAQLRDELESLPPATLFARCTRLRTGANPAVDPKQAVKETLRTLARQILVHGEELDDLRTALKS